MSGETASGWPYIEEGDEPRYYPDASRALADKLEADVGGGGSEPSVTDHGDLTGLGDDDHPQYLKPSEVLAGSNITVDTTTTPGSAIITGTPAGVTAHSALTGLNTGDDHPQYLNITRGDARYALLAHTHASTQEFQWIYDDVATMADPGTGEVRTDTAAGVPSTQVAFSDFAAGGVDASATLAALVVDDLVWFQEADNAANWGRYRITAAPTDNSTWWLIPIELVTATGTITKNQNVLVRFTYGSGGGGTGGSGSGATLLDDLLDVDAATPDDGDALVWNATAGMWVPSGTVEGGEGEVELPTGGVITEVAGGYRVHTFTSAGTFQMFSPMLVDALVVAGGGGGGSGGGLYKGGGGGAGGLLTPTAISLVAGIYTIDVGAGAATQTSQWSVGFSGGNSSAFGYISAGGGGGGGDTGSNATSGGSGGGSATSGMPAGSGTAGQGYAGSVGASGGGGGGGAGGAGGAGGNASNGGLGLLSSINGLATKYSSGGAGYAGGGTVDTGGGPAGAGAATGYGCGGGGGSATGGAGGSGIVIIRYLISDVISGGSTLDQVTADLRYVQLTGSTMTGALHVMPPLAASHAASMGWTQNYTAPVLVLGPTAPVPGGTAIGTVIIRTE